MVQSILSNVRFDICFLNTLQGPSASSTGTGGGWIWWRGWEGTTENPSAEREASPRANHCCPQSSIWWWTHWFSTGNPWYCNGRGEISAMTKETWRRWQGGKSGTEPTADGGQRGEINGWRWRRNSYMPTLGWWHPQTRVDSDGVLKYYGDIWPGGTTDKRPQDRGGDV